MSAAHGWVNKCDYATSHSTKCITRTKVAITVQLIIGVGLVIKWSYYFMCHEFKMKCFQGWFVNDWSVCGYFMLNNFIIWLTFENGG